MIPNADTKLVGRVRPIRNNIGSHIYNTLYQRCVINALYLQFETNNIKEFVQAVRSLGIVGCTVVGNHSHSIVPYLDQLDQHAANIGHINALTNHDGVLKGYKTDGPALIRSLLEVGTLEGKSITILGAGALARELCYLLPSEKPQEITLFNRSVDKAKAICNEFNLQFGGDIEAMGNSAKGDIFINATAIGSPSADIKDIFPVGMIDNFETILDVTYVPFSTALQQKASQLKKHVVPGWRMFAHQGALQQKLYLNVDVDVEMLSQLIKEEFASLV